MAKELGPYDTSLQMFVEKPKPLNTDTLIMWRRLAESGKMGRKPEGPPSGEVALAMVVQSNEPIEAVMRKVLGGKTP